MQLFYFHYFINRRKYLTNLIKYVINNIEMNKEGDKELIKRFIAWAVVRDLNQTGIAVLVGRSRAWASYIIRGEIKTLNFDTRNRILKIMGEL